MESSKSPSRRGPVTRRKAAEEQKEKEDAKRRRKMWKPRKVIGPNDIIVDTKKGKIKIECQEEEDIDVKALPAPESIQEEISSGQFRLDSEEQEMTPAPAVKVEYSEERSSTQDEIQVRNVLLEEIDIPMDCSGNEDDARIYELNNDDVRETRKIKIECPEEEDVDVNDVLDRVPTPPPEEISSENLGSDSEGHETTPAPTVKVENVEDGSSTQVEVRNVVLEEIEIPMDCRDGADDARIYEMNNDEVRKQCGSSYREELEMMKNVVQEQNQKIEMLVTRVTENEKELAELRGRLRKLERNTVWNLTMTSEVEECTLPDSSNEDECTDATEPWPWYLR